MPEVWYRAEDRRYANYDPWAEYEQPTGSHLKIVIEEYEVVRHTPKGVWLRDGFHETFVRGNAVRQKAVPTVALALRDLVYRKRRHVSCAGARLAQAEEHLRAAEKLYERTEREV